LEPETWKAPPEIKFLKCSGSSEIWKFTHKVMSKLIKL
jgi:hypothetical protein